MALTKEERQKLDETHDTVGKIKTVLVGLNGDEGLVGQVSEIGKSHYKLKRNFWMLVGFLVGSGVITGSVLAALSGG